MFGEKNDVPESDVKRNCDANPSKTTLATFLPAYLKRRADDSEICKTITGGSDKDRAQVLPQLLDPENIYAFHSELNGLDFGISPDEIKNFKIEGLNPMQNRRLSSLLSSIDKSLKSGKSSTAALNSIEHFIKKNEDAIPQEELAKIKNFAKHAQQRNDSYLDSLAQYHANNSQVELKSCVEDIMDDVFTPRRHGSMNGMFAKMMGEESSIKPRSHFKSPACRGYMGSETQRSRFEEIKKLVTQKMTMNMVTARKKTGEKLFDKERTRQFCKNIPYIIDMASANPKTDLALIDLTVREKVVEDVAIFHGFQTIQTAGFMGIISDTAPHSCNSPVATMPILNRKDIEGRSVLEQMHACPSGFLTKLNDNKDHRVMSTLSQATKVLMGFPADSSDQPTAEGSPDNTLSSESEVSNPNLRFRSSFINAQNEVDVIRSTMSCIARSAQEASPRLTQFDVDDWNSTNSEISAEEKEDIRKTAQTLRSFFSGFRSSASDNSDSHIDF